MAPHAQCGDRPWKAGDGLIPQGSERSGSKGEQDGGGREGQLPGEGTQNGNRTFAREQRDDDLVVRKAQRAQQEHESVNGRPGRERIEIARHLAHCRRSDRLDEQRDEGSHGQRPIEVHELAHRNRFAQVLGIIVFGPCGPNTPACINRFGQHTDRSGRRPHDDSGNTTDQPTTHEDGRVECKPNEGPNPYGSGITEAYQDTLLEATIGDGECPRRHDPETDAPWFEDLLGKVHEVAYDNVVERCERDEDVDEREERPRDHHVAPHGPVGCPVLAEGRRRRQEHMIGPSITKEIGKTSEP